MNAKEKYTEIIKELIRNEAVTDEKLAMLIKKFGTSKKNTSYYLRKTGVIEPLGKGVNRVLIRGQNIEPYVDEITALATPKKSKPVDGEYPHHEIMSDHMERSETDIDMLYAKIREVITKQEEKIDAHMNKVQTNTNKQNEYIAELKERIDIAIGRIVELEEKLNNLPSILSEVEEHLEFHRKQIGMYTEHDKRIAKLEDRMNLCSGDIEGLDDKIDILEDRIKDQTLIGNKNGMLKALHTLLGELV